MTQNEHKTRHDLTRSVRHLTGIIELIEAGFDFTTSQGKEILKEAKQAKEFINTYLETHIPKGKE